MIVVNKYNLLELYRTPFAEIIPVSIDYKYMREFHIFRLIYMCTNIQIILVSLKYSLTNIFAINNTEHSLGLMSHNEDATCIILSQTILCMVYYRFMKFIGDRTYE